MKKSALSLGYLLLATLPVGLILNTSVIAEDLELRGPLPVAPAAAKNPSTQDAIDSMSQKQIDALKKPVKAKAKNPIGLNFRAKSRNRRRKRSTSTGHRCR